MTNQELKGKKIRMILMNDPNPIPHGVTGIITHVDDIGQIHVNWDNGSKLAVIPDVDKFEIIY